MKELVLFGVTGDLAKQKLIPALFNLYKTRSIDKKSSFIGFGRKNFSKVEFQNFIEEILNNQISKNELRNWTNEELQEHKNQIRNFSAQWSYVESELDDKEGYRELASLLTTNQVGIYISLPPMYQYDVCNLLISCGVLSKSGKKLSSTKSLLGAHTGRKIALEKPYGFDTKSAEKLDALLTRKLNSHQILRVDHYAGKQALVELEATAKQGVFRTILSNETIKKITVQINESIDVSTRGSFYDAVGALSDIAQNHLLHMLATILALPEYGSNQKDSLNLAELRTEAVSALEISKKSNQKPILGQYEGFKETTGVHPNTKTETFFRIFAEMQKGKTNIQKRWGGTSIELIGGKALKEAEASIVLYPKSTLKGSLKEPIKILVNGYGSRSAYEQIFMDMFVYNPNRFIDFKQVKLGWNFIEKVKRMGRGSKNKLALYKKGSYPQDISVK